MSNKALWERVCITDPKAVKPITGKAYKGNSPKPYWLIERMTEEFGPVGVGWGVDVKSERFERLSETDVLHVAVVSVWYMHEGVRTHTFDQMGGTKAAYLTNANKMMIDEDAGKKSVTDGMVKCISMIGFAGDIFSGRWDDSKYVEFAREHYDNKPTPAEEEQRLAWIAEQKAAIAAAKTAGELKRIMESAIKTTQEMRDQDAEDQLREAALAKAQTAKPKTTEGETA